MELFIKVRQSSREGKEVWGLSPLGLRVERGGREGAERGSRTGRGVGAVASGSWKALRRVRGGANSHLPLPYTA